MLRDPPTACPSRDRLASSPVQAYDDRLADHVNRLVRFFVDGELVPSAARASPRPYSIRSGDYLFLQGDCTSASCLRRPAHGPRSHLLARRRTENKPGVVILSLHDIVVRPILDEQHPAAFSHWAAPAEDDALGPFSSILAGPSPVVYSPRESTPRGALFA